MMSNGPCSSRLSFHSGLRSIVAASTSSGVSKTKTWRKALALQAPERPAKLRLLLPDDVRAEVAVRPGRGSAPGRLSPAD